MRINTNVSALNAFQNLGKVQDAVSSSMQKLSSGFRINKASDDAAGLGIANKLRADTKALTQASRNAEQTNALLQVAEGSANTISSILERMKELATEAGSDTVDSDGRGRIVAEYDQLKEEITRTVNTTKYQGAALIDGTFSNKVDAASADSVTGQTYVEGVTISGVSAGTYTVVVDKTAKTVSITNADASLTQIVDASTDGAQSLSFDKFGVTIKLNASYVAGTSETTAGTDDEVVVTGNNKGSFLVGASGSYTTGGTGDFVTLTDVDLSLSTLGVGSLDLSTGAGARDALSDIDDAIGKVNTALGDIGAMQNRVNYALDNVKTAITNFSAAESVIRDVDMAEEMTKFSKNQILAQAGTAMLAQANQAGQGVLQLLRG